MTTSDEDMMMLKSMTSDDGGCLSGIRQSYPGTATDLDAAAKVLLLSSTSLIDRLRSLFGAVGNNYKTLAEGAS